jgi:hypothetical protein
MPYASHHLTMMIWKHLLAGRGPGSSLDYATFAGAVERWQNTATQVYEAMVEDLAVVLAAWVVVRFDQPHVLRDIAGAFRGGLLLQGLVQWFDPKGEPRRDRMRATVEPRLSAWKQRHEGRGHQLDLAGPESGDAD